MLRRKIGNKAIEMMQEGANEIALYMNIVSIMLMSLNVIQCLIIY